ncbi:MAG: CAP domain-containing protein [Actinomycetota bacterium]
MQTHAPIRRSRRLGLIAVPLVVMALATAGCVKGSPPPASPDAQALLQRVNEVRAANGRGPLAWCPTLANAATAHTQDMAAHGFMGHIGTDGSDHVVRANRHGYVRWNWVSENIDSGKNSVDEVMANMMSSGPHAANILDPRVHHAGFARVDSYWTLDFGQNGTC